MGRKRDPLERIESAMREGSDDVGLTGLEIDRADGLLLARSTLTSEQHAAWREKATQYREALPDAMLTEVENIERSILRFDPLDAIAHVAWINALHDAEDWDEHQFEGNDAYTEYIALLCLTHEYRDFDRPSLEESLNLDAQVIQSRIKRLFKLSAQEDQLEALESEAEPSPADELRFWTLLHEVGVRYPGSTQHLHELLTELLAPLSTEMTRHLGFDIAEAVALDAGIGAHLDEKLLKRIGTAAAFAKDLRKAVKRYRQKHEVPGSGLYFWRSLSLSTLLAMTLMVE